MTDCLHDKRNRDKYRAVAKAKDISIKLARHEVLNDSDSDPLSESGDDESYHTEDRDSDSN